MTFRSFGIRSGSLLAALVLLLGILMTPIAGGIALAQTVHKKKSFAQRHPTITSAAAGIAAYKIAKHTGRNRTRSGRKKNFAQRHPVLTGVGAAAITHHMIKKKSHDR